MPEFNLVPDEYRQQTRIQKWLSIFLATYLCLLGTILVSKLLLNHLQHQQKETFDSLQKTKQIWIEGKKKLNELRSEQQRLEKLNNVLSSLHKGPSARQIILALDRVMNENIWFDHLAFQWQGEVVSIKETVETGYIIIVPMDDANPQEKAWSIKTQLAIQGEVLNHSHLASLISALINQPEIADAQVIKTHVGPSLHKNVVTFEIAVSLSHQFGEHH